MHSNTPFFVKPEDEKRPITMPWGVHANCYAYAVNCLAPENGENGGAIPGLVMPSRAMSFAQYRSALLQGAIHDGLQKLDNPLEDPPISENGYYVVALLCHHDGFHWLRRDEESLIWSWKDGNSDPVKFNIFTEKNATNKYVKIKDGTEHALASLLDKDENKLYFPWKYSGMQFVSYFRVPNEGLSVKGMPEKKPALRNVKN